MTDFRKTLKKFLSGKPSNEGKAMYDAWYESFDDSANSVQPPSEEFLQQELHKIKQDNGRMLVYTSSPFSYWRIAASISILVVTAVAYWQWSAIIEAIDPVTYTEQVTPKGARLQLTLSDGTTVLLNANTQFRYPEKFKRGPREVYLQGEAYFDVTKDAAHPFIIHSGEVTTTVLGTSFNIQAYQNEENIEVAVVEGKVSVSIAKQAIDQPSTSITVLPNQKAVMSKNSQQLALNEFRNASKYLAWKEGRLIADNLSVKNILQVLNRTYDATIEVENVALEECRITAEFEPMALERVLDFMCAILNTTYSHKNGKYIIHGSKCKKYFIP